MKRKELITSPEYLTTKAQLDLYDCAYRFMEERGMNKAQLAEHLGVSRGYITQLLSGDFDHRLSKFFELAVAFGYVPTVTFNSIEDVILKDESARETKRTVYSQSSCLRVDKMCVIAGDGTIEYNNKQTNNAA